jgi:release factor glutamine methyltransferase
VSSPPNRREAIDGAAAELAAAGVESPRLEAERLLALATGLSRSELALSADVSLRPGQAGALARALSRRLGGTPLQHIEGEVEFRDLLLTCDGRALVPRPETEQLVELVARWSRERGAVRPATAGGVLRVPRPGRSAALDRVLDIGTGSGAIALALAREGIAARVVALDVSADALELAAENRARLGLEDRVELRPCGRSVWGAVRPGEAFDAIVSNPPYVPDEEIERLRPEVRNHEPRLALSGGPDGLAVIREIASGAAGRLSAGGALFLEIGADQGADVRRILASSAGFRRIEIRRDLSGRERIAVAST